MKKKKFVIIDAMALAYKAYYAFMNRPLANDSGEPTSAVFGFITQVLKILEDHKPDYFAAAFDSKEKTFRHELYELYKSSRQAMPEDMIPQIQRIKDIISALEIPVYILPGYEADDIIGTLVKQAEKSGFEAFAITPDKDYNQLVSENIKIVKPGKSVDDMVVIDPDYVRRELGFEPLQMIDYLALVGDSSDDIPGVAGIGPKGAVALIKEFGSVENIYKNIDSVMKASVRQKLIDSREKAFLSKTLATIHLDVPLDYDITKARFTRPDFSTVRNIFNELQFKNLTPRLEKVYNSCLNDMPSVSADMSIPANEEISESNFESSNVKYELVTDKSGAEDLANILKNSDIFVFDTETDSLDVFSLNLAGVSFCVKEGEAFFVAVNPFIYSTGLFDRELSGRLDIDDFVNIFGPVFEDSKIKKICQNAKFDMGVLDKYGIKTQGLYYDTMLASYVLDPDQKHGMDDLARKYLNYSPIPLSSLIGGKKDASKIFDVDPVQLSDYSCEDADITMRLYQALNLLVEQQGLSKLLNEIEIPLVNVLYEMEHEGVKIDNESLRSLSRDLQILMDNYTSSIFRISGEPFNINSSLQLQKILYDKLGLQAGRKTKTGASSTDARTLENLRGTHEIIDVILNYRTAAKLKSTYADALPALIEPATGRIHTSFNQTVVSTGRLSSNNPNLQNIPIRTELGKEIRKAFVPRDKDHIILSADYSQIELRIMASMCGDETMCTAFSNNEDIHRSTAALVFNVQPDKVTPDMRRRAKEVNFGILYGIGAFGLKSRLGITQAHAKEIIDSYFSKFSKVKDFMDECISKARSTGYSETLMGRRRFLKNINSRNQNLRQFEERVAVNMPVQGTAADMIKMAMIRIHSELKSQKARSRMVLQVHDELVFDVYKDELKDIKPLVKSTMETALPLIVPVVAEIGEGENWLEAH